ncbi:MAG: inorganic phosphate transporter [Thermodesulfobacteriota bacterium]
MTSDFLLIVIAGAVGLYMAWNIGANDVANSFGDAIGSKSLTFKQVVLVAIIFEFAGAVLVGANVTNTVRKGVVDPLIFSSNPELFIMGMISALFAAGVWLHIASSIGWPVSTTHAIVGAIVGFGLVGGGVDAIKWSKIVQIVLSWVISPVMGGATAAAMFIFINRRIIDTRDPLLSLKRASPYLIFVVTVAFSLSMTFKGLKNLHLDLSMQKALLLSSMVAVFASVIGKMLIDRVEPGRKGGFDAVEGVFRYLVIITSCYIAFAHGANDVANAIGPVAAVISVIKTKTLLMEVGVPLWVLLLGGGGIVLGLATYGYKVIETIGKKITEITPSRAFAADFGAATTVLVASKVGLPISTTHTLVGAIIGVGLVRGMAALNLKVIRDIIISWGVTIPFTMVLTIFIYGILVRVLV